MQGEFRCDSTHLFTTSLFSSLRPTLTCLILSIALGGPRIVRLSSTRIKVARDAVLIISMMRHKLWGSRSYSWGSKCNGSGYSPLFAESASFMETFNRLTLLGVSLATYWLLLLIAFLNALRWSTCGVSSAFSEVCLNVKITFSTAKTSLVMNLWLSKMCLHLRMIANSLRWLFRMEPVLWTVQKGFSMTNSWFDFSRKHRCLATVRIRDDLRLILETNLGFGSLLNRHFCIISIACNV